MFAARRRGEQGIGGLPTITRCIFDLKQARYPCSTGEAPAGCQTGRQVPPMDGAAAPRCCEVRVHTRARRAACHLPRRRAAAPSAAFLTNVPDCIPPVTQALTTHEPGRPQQHPAAQHPAAQPEAAAGGAGACDTSSTRPHAVCRRYNPALALSRGCRPLPTHPALPVSCATARAACCCIAAPSSVPAADA